MLLGYDTKASLMKGSCKKQDNAKNGLVLLAFLLRSASSKKPSHYPLDNEATDAWGEGSQELSWLIAIHPNTRPISLLTIIYLILVIFKHLIDPKMGTL